MGPLSAFGQLDHTPPLCGHSRRRGFRLSCPWRGVHEASRIFIPDRKQCLLKSTEGKGREDVSKQGKGDEVSVVQGFGPVGWIPCTTAVPFASAPSDACYQMDLALGGAPSQLFLVIGVSSGCILSRRAPGRSSIAASK